MQISKDEATIVKDMIDYLYESRCGFEGVDSWFELDKFHEILEGLQDSLDIELG